MQVCKTRPETSRMCFQLMQGPRPPSFSELLHIAVFLQLPHVAPMGVEVLIQQQLSDVWRASMYLPYSFHRIVGRDPQGPFPTPVSPSGVGWGRWTAITGERGSNPCSIFFLLMGSTYQDHTRLGSPIRYSFRCWLFFSGLRKWVHSWRSSSSSNKLGVGSQQLGGVDLGLQSSLGVRTRPGGCSFASGGVLMASGSLGHHNLFHIGPGVMLLMADMGTHCPVPYPCALVS